jgi:membrane protease YdiL (CAAX protease family)
MIQPGSGPETGRNGRQENQRAENLRLAVRVAVFVLIVLIGRIVFPIAMAPSGNILVVSALSAFATGAVANFVLARGWGRGTPADFGLAWQPRSPRELLTGIACGAGAAAAIAVAALALHLAYFAGSPSPASTWAGLPVLIIVLLFGAAGEELMFHGYAFQDLVRNIGPFATVLPVGILFGLAHAGNQNVTLLAVVNTAAWGVLLGVAYLRTRALWLPIGLHFGWNAAMPLFGVNLSGFTMSMTGYELRWRADALWSGGAYGFEGGLFTTIAVTALFFVLYRVTPGDEERL